MRDATEPTTPTLRQVVLDCEDARALAEFYRQLLGFQYRPGDEPPADGRTDTNGQEWLVLCDSTGTARLAFQQVPHLPEATWPEGPRPQMLHLDTTVPTLSDCRSSISVRWLSAPASSGTDLMTRLSHCLSTRIPPGTRFASS